MKDALVGSDKILSGCFGLKAPFMCLNEARYGIGWGVLGAARDSIECALAYAKERTQFGKPLAGFQLTQKKLVDMAVGLNQGYLLALHVGRQKTPAPWTSPRSPWPSSRTPAPPSRSPAKPAPFSAATA